MDKDFQHRFLVLRKTLPYAKKSVLPLFRHYIREWGLEGMCDINRTEGIITFANGSEILISGLDDPEKVKSIFGITSIWMEEATELTIDDFRQLNLRMRGKIPTYYQLILSFNPISDLSWIYKEFYGAGTHNQLKNKAKLHFSTYKDNKFLDKQYKEELEALIDLDYMWYKVYVLGEWGSLENIIYKKWNTVDNIPPDVQELSIGLDFGYTHPTAAVLFGVGKEGVYVKELLYAKGLTVANVIKRLKDLIPPEAPYARNTLNMDTPIYCDSARPDAIKEISQAGFNAIQAYKGKNSVREGINTIKSHKLHVVAGSDNVMRELRTYKWKEDKDGNVYDEPVKLNDDAMDAMRYAAFMTLRKKNKLIVVFEEF